MYVELFLYVFSFVATLVLSSLAHWPGWPNQLHSHALRVRIGVLQLHLAQKGRPFGSMSPDHCYYCCANVSSQKKRDA